MAIEIRVLMLVGTIFSLISQSAFAAEPGNATFYTPHTPSDCPGIKGAGPMVAAASDALWNNGDGCGKKFKVTCTGPPIHGQKFPCKGSVDVTIVDRCSSPACTTTLQLSKPAFNKIVDPSLTTIMIDYQSA